MNAVGPEPPPELENQFILRLPKHVSEEARKLVQSGGQTMKEKIAIEMQADHRHAIVKFGQEAYAAKLVDLPCIIESHKTFDSKTFWKTADICQMLVCTTDHLPAGEEDPSPKKPHEKVDKKFLWNHGITPPLKNVRKRRFRKSAKKKYIEAPDIEDEVKRLLRMDSTAIKIRWEVLADEDNKDENRAGSATAGDDLRQIFDDVSSSDDERQNVEVNVEDEDEYSRFSMTMDEKSQGDPTLENDEGLKPEVEDDDSQHQAVFTQRFSQIQKELEDMERKEKMLRDSLESVENPILKQRFLSQLDQVLEEKKQKEKEAETLEAIVGT